MDRTYSDRGQLATIAYNQATVDTRIYDHGGRLTSSTYNNGVSQTRSYNNDNTLAGIDHSDSTVGDYTYGWDNNKNKTSESITGTMSSYGFSVGSSGYDSEDRLVNWQRSDNNLDQSWNLSLVGDWDSYTENASVQNRTHGPTHEMLTVAGQAVQHDAKGNQTLLPSSLSPLATSRSLSRDFENKLIGADTDNDGTDDVTYQWDALLRRVGRDDGTTASVYVQNGQQTVADYTSGSVATSPTYTHVYASYVDEPVMRGGTGGLRYYHRNQQYSITALTNGGGTVTERYAYDAYGTPAILDASLSQLATSSENNRYLYTGREYDEALGLYHYRARIYNSLSGRFCSRDPIGFKGGINFHEYVGGNPVARLDPDGKQWWNPFGGGGPRNIKICFRWQDWDYGYFDCMAEPDRSREIKNDYKRRRDAAIATYRKSVQQMRQHLKTCCDKHNLNCDINIQPDFKLKPMQVRPYVDPNQAAMNIKGCDGGLRVLITTNHLPPRDSGRRVGATFPGIPFFWIGSGTTQTLSHECGHCGKYQAPDGQGAPNPPWGPDMHHNSDPDNLMHPTSGSTPDQNWCEAISRVANG